MISEELPDYQDALPEPNWWDDRTQSKPERPGKIRHVWAVTCDLCGDDPLGQFATYQEASIELSTHLREEHDGEIVW